MAASNALAVGLRQTGHQRNSFIRIFFLVVVVGTLIRFAYDVFFKD
jgi:hypothetical protein